MSMSSYFGTIMINCIVRVSLVQQKKKDSVVSLIRPAPSNLTRLGGPASRKVTSIFAP